MTTSQDNQDPSAKSFFEHLEDLRRAVTWSLLSLAVGMALAVPLAPHIMHLLMAPLKQAGVDDPEKFLKVMSVSGGFTIAMQVVLWSGLVIGVPGVVFSIGTFVFPGLKHVERRAVLFATGFSAVLFALGVWVGYAPTLPLALKWLFQLNNWMGVSCEFVDVSDYVRFAAQLLICFGLAFQLPVVIVALGYIGIITSQRLRQFRRHAIIALMIAASALTPGPDPVSMLIVAAPLLLLYEMCIWIIWAMERK